MLTTPLKTAAYVTLFLTLIPLVYSGEPGEPPYRWAIEKYMYLKLLRLTKWLCKDATLKLRQATRVQGKYKDMVSYELGTIAAGIQDKFQHMLDVYRKYSNMTQYRSDKYSEEKIFNAYHIIKGDFNEIRLERNMYYDVVASHQKKMHTGKKLKDKLKELLGKFRDKPKSPKRRFEGNLTSLTETDRDLEEEYKRSLRYKKWAEKWNNFIPEVEGVDIDEEARPKF